MWFDSWGDLGRVLAVGTAAYVTLVVLLRFSGKRTLAKLNAFDLVVTVALGSVLATAVLSKDVTFVDALTGMMLLIGAQWLVTRVTTSLPGGRRFLNAEPTLVLADGEIVESALSEVRLTEGEIMQAVRSSGQGGFDAIAAVVLEPDGSLSVIPRSAVGDARALAEVPRWPG